MGDDDLDDPEWEDIIGNGKLRFKTTRAPPEDAAQPERGNLVTMKTTVRVNDEPQGPPSIVKFRLRERDDVPAAWDIMAEHMKVGEEREVRGHVDYDDRPGLPEGAKLSYVLELVRAVDFATVPLDERLQDATERKNSGNKIFAAGDHARAIAAFRSALTMAELQAGDEADDKHNELKQLTVSCWTNIAVVHLKTGKFNEVLMTTDEALKINPKLSKGLYLRAKAQHNLKKLEEARATVEQGLALDPNNVGLQLLRREIAQEEKAEVERQREVYARMMSGLGKGPAEWYQDENKKATPGDDATKTKISRRWIVLLMAVFAVICVVGAWFMYMNQSFAPVETIIPVARETSGGM